MEFKEPELEEEEDRSHGLAIHCQVSSLFCYDLFHVFVGPPNWFINLISLLSDILRKCRQSSYRNHGLSRKKGSHFPILFIMPRNWQ